MLECTEQKLDMIHRNVKSGRWKKEKVIAKRVHTWINKWNMERFFTYDYGQGRFEYSRKQEKIEEFEGIDGFYVIITDTSSEQFSTEEARANISLSQELSRHFATLKQPISFSGQFDTGPLIM